MTAEWRVGEEVPTSVYENDRLIARCNRELDAERIVAAMTLAEAARNAKNAPVPTSRHWWKSSTYLALGVVVGVGAATAFGWQALVIGFVMVWIGFNCGYVRALERFSIKG